MTAALTASFSRRTEDQRALMGASVAVFFWGFGPLLVRGVGASAGAIVFWRLLLAQPFMIAAAYATGGRLSVPVLRRALMPGFLFATSLAAGFVALQKTSIVNASLIGALQPALLLVVAPLVFATRSSGRQIGLAVLATSGLAAVVIGAGATSGASIGGDLWAVANLIIWTVYFVRVKQIRDDGVHAPSFIAAVFLVAFVLAAPVTLMVSDDVGSVSFTGMALITAMAVGPGLIGHGLMTWSQGHLDIRVASLLNLASPIVATIGAWVIYSQDLKPVQVGGGLVVLAALAGIVWEHHNAQVVLSGALDQSQATGSR